MELTAKTVPTERKVLPVLTDKMELTVLKVLPVRKVYKVLPVLTD